MVVSRGIVGLLRVDMSATCIRSPFGKYEVIVQRIGSSSKSRKFVVVFAGAMMAALLSAVPTIPVGDDDDVILDRFGGVGCRQEEQGTMSTAAMSS